MGLNRVKTAPTFAMHTYSQPVDQFSGKLTHTFSLQQGLINSGTPLLLNAIQLPCEHFNLDDEGKKHLTKTP